MVFTSRLRQGTGPVDVVVRDDLDHSRRADVERADARAIPLPAGAFSRLILFDKRGTGLSDRVPDDRLPSLEVRMDDARAVMDALGSERAIVMGFSGGPMATLFAATYFGGDLALVLFGQRMLETDG
jgi:pimeloyl-ACP methyl ester carboxylesterase